MQDLDETRRVMRETKDLRKARLACATLREHGLLGCAPQAVVCLARLLLGSLVRR